MRETLEQGAAKARELATATLARPGRASASGSPTPTAGWRNAAAAPHAAAQSSSAAFQRVGLTARHRPSLRRQMVLPGPGNGQLVAARLARLAVDRGMIEVGGHPMAPPAAAGRRPGR